MSGNIFFTSDTHFSHANILTFRGKDGDVIRPFASVEEMDETMVERWNSVVRDGDKIYHLGDLSFNKARLPAIMNRLRGSKRLVVGNHDDIKRFDLCAYFKRISLWRIFKEHNFMCTHVPLAKEQMRKVDFNVHGHIHEKPEPSAQHICVCVERTNYTPIHLDEVLSLIAYRGAVRASAPAVPHAA